ncbi:MAG: InlB B-repeat-containing protein, partial [Ruminococcus sp.]|nr:InlB B-repeat-containing protein [Ruminococcus sp.]
KLNATGGYYTFGFANNSEQFTIAYEPYVYTVRFLDWDGTVLKSEQVEISKNATAPADPTREHYNFTGWDKDFTNIQGNLDVNATYAIHTFEVTFVYIAADGKTKLTNTQTIDYGSAAKAPELPRRQDGWAFKNWDKDFSFITEDITVKALYIDDNVYLVGEFNSWNEKATPMQLTSDPNIVTIKITLDEGSYDFKLKRGDGWYSNEGDINNTTDVNGSSNPLYMDANEADNCTLITAGGNYTFIYNKETQKLEVKYSPYTFVVTFVDWDGTVLKTQTVDIGTDATAPMNPTRPDEGNIVYTFVGWDTKFSKVKEDLTVKALYEATTRQLTVTFVDWNGTVLKTDMVDRGKDATPPATPTREGTAEFSYEFAGWDPSFKNVQTDLTVKATYIQVINKYTVTFVDYNDKVITTQEVEYGKSATAPADPSRGDNFIFTGWDKDFSKITEDITVKATYGDNKVYLKGDFNNWGNTTVMQKTGDNTYEVRIELEEGSYDFKINRFETWYGNNGDITDTTDQNGVSNPWFMPTDAGDCTIIATGGEYIFTFNTETQKLEVKHVLEKFTVVFQDADGTLLKTEEVEYGKSATAPANPTAPEGFKFAGWDTEFKFITADTIVTAVYAEIGAQFEVIFVDWDGTVLSTQVVEAGTAAVAPAAPTREGDAQFSYNFTGWDKDFSQVSDHMTITAQYEQVVNKYEVRFVDWDGRTLAVRSVEYGKGVDNPPADPVRDGFLFTGWDKDFSVITENTIVTAQYADQNQLFTVKFWNYDGSKLLKEETVSAGSRATAPAPPTREETAEFRYVFTGWDKEFSNVTSDLDVYPVYNNIKQVYTVTFRDYDNTILDMVTVEYGNPAY